jgi:RNA polymerase sigma factor (sigma-70 family)
MAHPLDNVVQHIRRVAANQGATDGELLQSFVTSNDQAAFASLVKRHGPLVFAVCKRVLGNVEDAEDAFQAAFVVLARNAAKLPRRCSLSTWLHGVAFKISLNARRLASRRRRHERQAQTMVSTNPAWDAAWREVQLFLDEEVQRLPEKYREPFILCCLEGQSYAAAAQQMGVKESTVHGRLTEARRRLQSRLSRRGVELTAVLGAAALAPGAATAQVPSALVAKAVSAATSTALPASVAALVKGVAASLAINKAKVGIALFVVFSGLVGTASMWAVQKEPGGKEKAPRAQAEAKQEAAVKAEPTVAKDIYGDPLPPGAVARLGTIRFRHDGGPERLAFSGDGKILVGSTSSGIIFWEASSGKELHRLKELAPGRLMDVSPHGNNLAVVTRSSFSDALISLWDIRNAEKLRTVDLPTKEIETAFGNHLATFKVTRDGNTFAVAFGSKVGIFDMTTGKRTTIVGKGDAMIMAADFSPDSKMLAVATLEPALQLWDIGTGKLLHGINDPKKGFAHSVAFSPNGEMVAASLEGRIILVDSRTGQQLRHLDTNTQTSGCLVFTPDGKTLVSGTQNGELRVWNTATGEIRFNLNSAGVTALALSPDGTTAALGGYGSSVQLWNVDTGKRLFTQYQGHEGWPYCLAFSPDGKTLASADGEARLWDTTRWKPIRVMEGEALTLSFSPDSQKLASRVWNGALYIKKVDSSDKPIVIRIPNADVRSGTFSADGNKLFTLDTDKPAKEGRTGSRSSRLRQWSAATGQEEKLWMVPEEISQEWGFAPAGVAYSATDQKAIHFMEWRSGRDRVFRGVGDNAVSTVAISPDGRMLVSGDWTRAFTANIWEIATGKKAQIMKAECVVTGAAWSADGRFLATCCDYQIYGPPAASGPVQLWDAASGKELMRFSGFNSSVSRLAFSPDGSYLAGSLHDSTILVWDIRQAIQASKQLAARLQPKELEACWKDLICDDVPKAYKAIWKLTFAPHQAVPFLRERMQPTPVMDAAKIQKWIADLDSDTFAVRQAAAKELEKAGEQVRPFIQDALKGNVTLETRRRLEQILATLANVPGPETLRTIRAIMALERIGSPDAQAVLRTLARGAPGARETEEAKVSLERLAQRVLAMRL